MKWEPEGVRKCWALGDDRRGSRVRRRGTEVACLSAVRVAENMVDGEIVG